MKSSLKKLRGFALHHRQQPKGTLEPFSLSHADEVALAAKDMKDMRNCYDTLLTAAAAATNSAYEFAESLREMGTCLLERTTMSEDEESAKVLLLLGKSQFELQKLVDRYRSHIIQTITTPSESLLKELQTLEEMKHQCDDKRDVYNFMLASHTEKGSSKNIKNENLFSQKLQAAQEDYDEEATLFAFRLKSLKQGQSRSLLTQASRHYAAQLRFFRRGVRSLEEVESQVQEVAKRRHIDYNFSDLEDETEEDDDDDNGSDSKELPFDYKQNLQMHDDISTSRNSMDLDRMDHACAPIFTSEQVQGNADRRHSEFVSFSRAPRTSSHSVPILKSDPFERSTPPLQPSSSKKFHTYVLPTPSDLKTDTSTAPGTSISSRQETVGPTQSRHSSPLTDPTKLSKHSRDRDRASPTRSTEAPVMQKETKNTFPPSSTVELSLPQVDQFNSYYDKKIKRQAYSGPLTGKVCSNQPFYHQSDSSPLPSSIEYPCGTPSVCLPVPSCHPSVSPKASPGRTLHRTSSPRIDELHELPRPPSSSGRDGRLPSLISHSAPLVARIQERHSTSKISSHKASPLPIPPGAIARSFSIPSSGPRMPNVTVAELLESPDSPEMKLASTPEPNFFGFGK